MYTNIILFPLLMKSNSKIKVPCDTHKQTIKPFYVQIGFMTNFLFQILWSIINHVYIYIYIYIIIIYI